ncbi:hypothetical protein [Gottfriedia acidiceleris]|uniref:hypothetical protein n=1 Tax=Gottfriedia acidiceleris TaxID=371036 RepID=UPI00101BEBE2|nr:hypothetical protein [Gottfriedia acidiceleris]
MEYRGIKLHESVNLNGSNSWSILKALDSLIDLMEKEKYKIISVYKNTIEKNKFICSNNHEFELSSTFLLYRNRRCPECKELNKKTKEYRGITVHKDVELTKTMKDGLVLFIDLVEEKGHEIKGIFINNTTPIEIDFKCEHGSYEVPPKYYKRYKGKCGKCSKLEANERNFNQAKDKFYRTLEERGHEALDPYQGAKVKIRIDFKCVHPPHPITPNDYDRYGCRNCGFEAMALKQSQQAREEFSLLVKSKGHTLLSDYINSHEKVLIDFHCEHEPQCVIPNDYKNEHGCRKCGGTDPTVAKERFLNEVKEANYKVNGEYVNNKTKVPLICDKKHNFEMTPNDFNGGARCKYCKRSKGERAICNWLDKQKIKYEIEYRLPKRTWKYDIYIPSLNLIIEVHGIQHYKFHKRFHETKEDFVKQQETDRKKKAYAEKLGYQYVEIDYREHKQNLTLERFKKFFEEFKTNQLFKVEKGQLTFEF